MCNVLKCWLFYKAPVQKTGKEELSWEVETLVCKISNII